MTETASVLKKIGLDKSSELLVYHQPLRVYCWSSPLLLKKDFLTDTTLT